MVMMADAQEESKEVKVDKPKVVIPASKYDQVKLRSLKDLRPLLPAEKFSQVDA